MTSLRLSENLYPFAERILADLHGDARLSANVHLFFLSQILSKWKKKITTW